MIRITNAFITVLKHQEDQYPQIKCSPVINWTALKWMQAPINCILKYFKYTSQCQKSNTQS